MNFRQVYFQQREQLAKFKKGVTPLESVVQISLKRQDSSFRGNDSIVFFTIGSRDTQVLFVKTSNNTDGI